MKDKPINTGKQKYNRKRDPMDLKKFATETRNRNSMNLDRMSALEIVTLMNQEDRKICPAIEEVLPEIAKLVDTVAMAFENGGRLIYMGAGTSGRLGVLDASECPPTYGVSPDMVVGIMAGGDYALRNDVVGDEDKPELGKQNLIENKLTAKDVVVGIAASGRTPFVIGGLEYAKEVGCTTAAIACNKGSAIGKITDITIEAEPGPEVLTGSTRLKAGTTQKMILNMITTASMVRCGKAYENLMVDVVQSCDKLCVRIENIVMDATGVSREEARAAIDEADQSAKLAITKILTGTDITTAKGLLEEAKSRVYVAIQLAQNK